MRYRLVNLFDRPAKAARKEFREVFPKEATEILEILERQISRRPKDCDLVEVSSRTTEIRRLKETFLAGKDGFDCEVVFEFDAKNARWLIFKFRHFIVFA